jgi:hypothetical protein
MSSRDTVRLVDAEALKLRRRRGLLALVVLLTAGAMGTGFVLWALLPPADGHSRLVAGGAHHFDLGTQYLSLLAGVAGALVGATAGAQDAEARVWRDLVATGRSRLALFAARPAGALIVLLPVLVLAVGVAWGCSVLLAGSLPAPSLALVARAGGVVLAAGAVSALVAAGVGTVAGSRGPAIAVVLVWLLVLSQAAIHATGLGPIRALVPLAALGRLQGSDTVPMSLLAAAGVLAGWSALALAAGAWRACAAEA